MKPTKGRTVFPYRVEAVVEQDGHQKKVLKERVKDLYVCMYVCMYVCSIAVTIMRYDEMR